MWIQVELDRKASNDRIQRQEAEWRKERDQLIGRATDFEVELKVIHSPFSYPSPLFPPLVVVLYLWKCGSAQGESPINRGVSSG